MLQQPAQVILPWKSTIPAPLPAIASKNWEEFCITSKMPLSTHFTAWLSRTIVNPSGELLWVSVYFFTAHSIPRACFRPLLSYKPYLMRFVGQLWAARSTREYSLQSQTCEDDKLVRLPPTLFTHAWALLVVLMQ
jgi:hypothetical protein